MLTLFFKTYYRPNKACVLVDFQSFVPLQNAPLSQATRPLMTEYLEHTLLCWVSVLWDRASCTVISYRSSGKTEKQEDRPLIPGKAQSIHRGGFFTGWPAEAAWQACGGGGGGGTIKTINDMQVLEIRGMCKEIVEGRFWKVSWSQIVGSLPTTCRCFVVCTEGGNCWGFSSKMMITH